MPDYRRWRVPGGTYFFTGNLLNRRQKLLIEHINLLRTAFRDVRKGHPFHIDAIVILPEHLHSLWTLPAIDSDYSTRWRMIKGQFAKSMPFQGESRSFSLAKHRERGIWQRRFWEHVIRDECDYAQHVDYIHCNPVKHGHVKRPIDWPYSSIHRFVRRGLLTADWGTDGSVVDLNLD